MHYFPNFLEAIMVKCPALGHKCHDGDRTLTLLQTTPELGFGELDHSARTRHDLSTIVSGMVTESNIMQ